MTSWICFSLPINPPDPLCPVTQRAGPVDYISMCSCSGTLSLSLQHWQGLASGQWMCERRMRSVALGAAGHHGWQAASLSHRESPAPGVTAPSGTWELLPPLGPHTLGSPAIAKPRIPSLDSQALMPDCIRPSQHSPDQHLPNKREKVADLFLKIPGSVPFPTSTTDWQESVVSLTPLRVHFILRGSILQGSTKFSSLSIEYVWIPVSSGEGSQIWLASLKAGALSSSHWA